MDTKYAGTIALSENALALLHLHFGGGTLIVGGAKPESLPGVSLEATKAAYRELTAAGLMMPLHSFVGGRDSVYRLTDHAKMRREELRNGT
jgi:hypothetical protein